MSHSAAAPQPRFATEHSRASVPAQRAAAWDEPRSGCQKLTRALFARSLFCIVKGARSEEHTSELQSHSDLVCRLLLEKKKNIYYINLLKYCCQLSESCVCTLAESTTVILSSIVC